MKLSDECVDVVIVEIECYYGYRCVGCQLFQCIYYVKLVVLSFECVVGFVGKLLGKCVWSNGGLVGLFLYVLGVGRIGDECIGDFVQVCVDGYW